MAIRCGTLFGIWNNIYIDSDNTTAAPPAAAHTIRCRFSLAPRIRWTTKIFSIYREFSSSQELPALKVIVRTIVVVALGIPPTNRDALGGIRIWTLGKKALTIVVKIILLTTWCHHLAGLDVMDPILPCKIYSRAS